MKIKIKLRTLLAFGCIILSLFLFPLLSLWKKSNVQDMVKENEMLRERIHAAKNENVVHRFVCDRLTARTRIETVARKELGLEYPANQNVKLVVRTQPLKAGDPALEKALASR